MAHSSGIHRLESKINIFDCYYDLVARTVIGS